MALTGMMELMDREGAFILMEQGLDETAYDGEIRSIEEYQEISGQNLEEPRPFDVQDGEEYQRVLLPRFACRSKSRQGYIKEFEQAGFKVLKVYDGEDGNAIDIILTT